MINKVISQNKSKLLTVSLLSVISTGVKMITSFFMAKIIATELGPQGLGIIGQLNSFMLIVMSLSTGGITNGVVKYLAQYSDNKEKQNQVIHAAVSITIFFTIILGLIVGFGATFWSNHVFNGKTEFFGVFIVFGVSLIFYATFNLFVSILNGFQLYMRYNLLNIVTSISGLIFTAILVNALGLIGALYASVTYQSIVFILLFFFKPVDLVIQVRSLFNRGDNRVYIDLMKFSLMTIVSTICVPYVQLLIRNYIELKSGAIDMGYYEGITRISNIYLTVITTTLSVYYLPKLSELKDKQALRNEIWLGYRIIIPSLVLFVLIVFFSKSFIIKIVFSKSFSGMSDFFLPQLIGDILKISSWLLAFIMLAKAMTRQFIITEVIFSLSLYLLTILMVSEYGSVGAIYAYAINYFVYLLTMVFLFRKVVF